MSEETSFLFAEYAHPVVPRGKIRRGRVLLILLYLTVSAAYALFFISVSIPHVIAILPLLLWILVHYTWGLVSFEYFVRVESGVVSFGKLLGKKEKVLFTCRAKDLTCVKKMSREVLAAYAPSKTLDFRSDPLAHTSHFAILSAHHETVAILFEATDAVLTAMRYYNKSVER